MAELRRVVVAGAGLAGLTAADTLRRRGFAGSIAIVGTEPHPPYDRPPLSKQVLAGEWDAGRARLRSSREFEAAGADWYLGEPADLLDLAERELRTVRGRRLPWDGLVIATGARPRRLPVGRRFSNVRVLRTLDDALALREAFATARSVVVVGAGFLGCEVAAAARAAGLEVALADPLAVPMERHLGPVVGRELAALHRGRGVRLHLGRTVAGIEGGATAERVLLDDGTELGCDLVVTAVGCEPDVGWLAGSGLPLSDGVVCDERLRAAPGVVAAGDVANWLNPEFGVRMRVEHRTNAAEQGAAAALTLLGAGTGYAAVPYFWSEQFGVRIQAHGHFAAAERLEVVAGAIEDGRFAAVLHGGDGPVAGLTWNLPKANLDVRRRVLEACAARRLPQPVG